MSDSQRYLPIILSFLKMCNFQLGFLKQRNLRIYAAEARMEIVEKHLIFKIESLKIGTSSL